MQNEAASWMQQALEAWQRNGSNSAAEALALLEAAEALARASARGLAPDATPAGAAHALPSGATHGALWRAYLDQSGDRRFLLALGTAAARVRWAETAFHAIRQADYRLAQLLERNVARFPGRTFLQENIGRGAVRWSYAQVERQTRAIAAALFELEPVPRVALLSANDLQGALCDLACLIHGIFISPLDVHSDEETLHWIFESLGINTVVVDSAARCGLLTRVATRLGRPLHLVTLREAPGDHDEISLAQAVARLDHERTNAILAGQPQRPLLEVATVLFTSGSTGMPKGVSFSEYHLVSKRFARHAALPEVGEDEKLFAYLPLYHTFGRYLELLGMLYWGGTYVFANNPSTATLLAGLAEHAPTGLISIPLRWQQIHERCLELLDRDPDANPARLLRRLVGPRLRWGLSAAGYLDPRSFRFFQQHGIALCSGFGMTEATGGITMSPPGDYRDDTVGIPLPGITLRFGASGELELQGHYVARYLDEAGPGDLIDPDEDYWLPTGDIFEPLQGGHVKIVDRIKDIYKNSKGQTIAPRRVEQKFTSVPGIERTFLVGDGRTHNVLLIVPRRDDPVLKTATEGGDMYAYYGRLIAAANQDLVPCERVVNFAVLDHDFSSEAGELTPKGSYRRKVIQDNFSDTIESLYRSKTVKLADEALTVLVPRWLYSDLGLLETDLHFEDGRLKDERLGRSLRVAPSGEAGWVRIGDLEYKLSEPVVDLGLFCRQPWLWLGNPALVAFCGVKAGWDIPLRGVERTLRLPGPAEHGADSPAKAPRAPLGQLRSTSLVAAHQQVQRAFFAPLDQALAAVEELGTIIARSNQNLAALLRRRLEALATHPAEALRCAAYRMLLLDEPLLDYNEAFPAFIASQLTFLDRASIDALARSDLKPQRLQALRQRLASYRLHLQWPATASTRAQFESIFQLLVDFVLHHPDYFVPIRAELAAWALLDQDPALAATAHGHLVRLIDWFDQQIDADPVATDRCEWERRLVFENSISAPERERLFEALTDGNFFRKSMLLVNEVGAFSLATVAEAGIWVTKILTSADFRRYRLSINCEQHYELQLVVRYALPNQAQLRGDLYAMAMAGYPFDSPVLPSFGHWQPDGLFASVGYAPDLTVWEKIRQYASGGDSPGRRGWARHWRKLFVRGLTTLFAAWEASERRIVPGCISPTNVVVPELDFRESAVVLSLTDHAPYQTPRDLLTPMVLNFYHRTVAHYPWCAQYLDRDWIFDAALGALGIERGVAWVEELLADLEAAGSPAGWPDAASRARHYLVRRAEEPLIPLPLDNAVDQFERWRSTNPTAPAAAREDVVLQLLSSYRIERYGEWGRLQLYRMTLFAEAPEEVALAFDLLLRQMSENPATPASQLVELSDLQEAVQDSRWRQILNRMVFPGSTRPHSLKVDRLGREERSLVVVRSEIVDRPGARYQVRPPLDPAEIGRLYRLFFNEKFPQRVREDDQYLVAIDSHEQIVGGLCYRISEDRVAAVDAMVIARPVQRRGLGRALLDDCCTRMHEQGAEIVKVHVLLRELATRQGFLEDPRWGGLVRGLNGAEHQNQARPPQL